MTVKNAPGVHRLDSTTPRATTNNPQETPQEGMTMFAQATSTREIVYSIAGELTETAEHYRYIAGMCLSPVIRSWYIAAADDLEVRAGMAVDDLATWADGGHDVLPDAVLWDDVAHALEGVARDYRDRAAASTDGHAAFLRTVADDLDAAAARVRADGAEVWSS